MYGTTEVPIIPIQNIEDVPIILYVGKEDTFSTIEDANWLANEVHSIDHTYFVDNFNH